MLCIMYVLNMVVLNLAIFTTFDNESYSVQKRYTRINLLLKRLHMRNLHPGANLLTGANLHPGANLHRLASRSYANKLCPYAPRFYLKFNTRY